MGDSERGGGYRFDTLAAASHLDGIRESRPINVPIVQSTTFQAESAAAHAERHQARDGRVYQRLGNPTVAATEEKMARLEGAEAGLAFGSGMGAISAALLALLRPGDHVVVTPRIYAHTRALFSTLVPRLGVGVTFTASAAPEHLRESVTPRTRLLYTETPANPGLELVDLEAVSRLGAAAGALVVVDNTFASPALQNPLALGAHLVLHSGTKYLAGHSDVMCGFVVGSRELVDEVERLRVLLGAVLDPHAAFLVLRGLKTLAVRVERQSRTALRLARFLEGAPAVERVHYPWLESADDYRLARRQMRAGGGMLSFTVRGGREAARALIDALRLIPIATSLGGVESIIEIPRDLYLGDGAPPGEASDTAAPSNLIRLSVGLEDPEDLEADLQQGLDVVARSA